MTTADQEQPVVAGIDGSDASLAAATWAAEFAAAHGTPLVLLHAVPRLDWHFAPSDTPAERDGNGTQVLAAAEAAVRAAHPDLVTHTSLVRAPVATALADASRSARMVVVGAGAAEQRALGGHAVRTVHQAQCPVVVWRAPVATRTGKPLPVVVGVDESEASGRALAEAFDIARVAHAQLTVAHMWEIDAAVGMGDLGGEGSMDWQLLDVLETQQRGRMEELVAPLAKKYPNAHVVKVFQDVSPAKGLTDLSREAQLLVVGSHGRGRIAGSILGSVSQNLIHHAECPVLVVR